VDITTKVMSSIPVRDEVSSMEVCDKVFK